METLALWKTILMSNLDVLTQLEGQDEVSQMRHAMKEQEIGQHCLSCPLVIALLRCLSTCLRNLQAYYL